MKTAIAVACGLFLFATLTPLCSAKPLALEAPDPGCGVIGVRVKVIPPAHMGSSFPEVVYFVRVVEDADRYGATSLIDSNYTDGRDVYLLNAKPGRYVAIGCRLASNPATAGPAAPVAPGLSVGVAISPASATVLFSKADILRTEVEVRAGAVVFMGAIEAHSSTKTRESDEAQAHYLRMISPEAASQGSMARAFSGHLVYLAAFKSIERGEAATAKFWDEAIEKHFVNERAWAGLIARGSSVHVGVAAGASSAGASMDEFLSAVCINANATKARAYGQPKEAEEIARLACKTVMTDWDSRGCAQNPDQDPCKKRLTSLDGSLRSSGSSMLFAAAQAGQTSICSVMLAMGSDPNAAISTGKTPVMISAESGHPEIVEILTKASKEAPPKEDSGAAPGDDLVANVCVEVNIDKARAAGHQEKADEMARLVCQTATKDWAAHGCRENPDQDPCRQALGVSDANLKGSGPSMLFAAAQAGRTDICSVLLAAGSDPSAAISTSWTPVMIAAAENKPETVKLLLAKGANPNARNSLGRTPVMFAANYGYTEIVEMLAGAGADLNTKATDKEEKSTLIAAACKGHAGTVTALLRLGAHAEAVDADGLTALMHASLDGSLEVMRALLDGGAEINSGVLIGTPLAMAGEEGHVDAVKLLLERGADVNRAYRNQAGLEGVTPLMIAANEGQVEVVRLLVAAGADLNARNSLGSTALDLATTAGKDNVVEILRGAASGAR